MTKSEYVRSEKHRRWIANLPCVVCNRNDVQAAHIRHGNGAGVGLKSSDKFCLPLCCGCHTIQGKAEVKFWETRGSIEKASELAVNLYKVTGDNIKGMKEIVKWRHST